MVVPRDVGKDEFFTSWYAVLEELSKGDKPKVKDLHVGRSRLTALPRIAFLQSDYLTNLCLCTSPPNSSIPRGRCTAVHIVSDARTRIQAHVYRAAALHAHARGDALPRVSLRGNRLKL